MALIVARTNAANSAEGIDGGSITLIFRLKFA